MNKFLSIMFHEFKVYLKDQATALVMIVGVMGYVFCYSLPYYNEIIQEVPIVVVDIDQTKLSKTYIKNLNATDYINIVKHVSSIDEAEKELYKGNIKGFLLVPDNFEKDILRGEQSNVALYADSAYLIVYKTIYTAVMQTSTDLGAKIEISKMMKQGVPKRNALAIKQPFEFIQVPLYNSIGGYKSYVYPIILILIVHQTLIMAVGLLQGTRNEKKEKYAKSNRDIPVAILAKTTAYIALYVFYASVVFLAFPMFFRYRLHYHNIIPFFMMYLLMMYAAAFFAQTISYWLKIREHIMLILVPLSLIFIFIPGVIWPKEAIPQIINFAALFIPATCGVDGIIKINQNGAGVIDVFPDYIWLAFLCVIYYFLAIIVTNKLDAKIEDNANK